MTTPRLPDAYPLQWPEGWERTDHGRRRYSDYKVGETKARDEMYDAIRKLGGAIPIVSSNMRIRLDGIPYAKQTVPDDPGVAVYWVRDGKQEVMACDRWLRPWENMRAIYHAIEGLRAMERAGATQIMERAFQAFQLPAGGTETKRHWREIFKLAGSDTGVTFAELDCQDAVKKAYRALVLTMHPDKGGDEEKFKTLGKAYEQAMEELDW